MGVKRVVPKKIKIHKSGESDGESSTTSDSWQEKLSISITLDVSTKFLLVWDFEMKNSTTKEVSVRVEQNDTTEVAYTCEDGVANEYMQRSGDRLITLASGTNTFDIDFKRPSTGTAYIRRANLYLLKVY